MIYTSLFRFVGDFLMFSSRAVMLKKISQTKSVSGLSLKTHLIYLITYILRYTDLFNAVSYSRPLYIYNSICKIIFISYQFLILYLMLLKYKHSYSRRYDSFPISVLLGSSALLGILLNIFDKNPLDEYLYTISLILESVAILPQLVMTQEEGVCESMTSSYIILLGLYRLNYLIFFVLKRYEGFHVDLLMIVTSLVQSALYVDFFVVYFKNNKLDSEVKKGL